MYAIIAFGSKQYKVVEGDVIETPKLKKQEGEKILFSTVLMVNNGGLVTLGSPYLDQVSVEGIVLSHFKTKKITVLRVRAKSRSRKKKGQRVEKTKVKIEKILTKKKTSTKEKKKSSFEGKKPKKKTTRPKT